MTRDEAVKRVADAIFFSGGHTATDLAKAAIAGCLAILGEPTEVMIAKAGSWFEPHEAEEAWQLMLAASPLSQGGQDG